MPPKSKDTPPAEPVVDPAAEPAVEPAAEPAGDKPAADVADPAIGTWSVAEPTDAEPASPAAVPFLSEGIRQELEQLGKAGDPATGGKFERDADGRVTYTDRAGNVTEL